MANVQREPARRRNQAAADSTAGSFSVKQDLSAFEMTMLQIRTYMLHPSSLSYTRRTRAACRGGRRSSRDRLRPIRKRRCHNSITRSLHQIRRVSSTAPVRRRGPIRRNDGKPEFRIASRIGVYDPHRDIFAQPCRVTIRDGGLRIDRLAGVVVLRSGCIAAAELSVQSRGSDP